MKRSRLLDAFLPNRAVDAKTMGALIAFWTVVGLVLWVRSPFESLPRPMEVYRALRTLWWEQGLAPELFSTMRLIGHALLVTVLISLALAYGTVFAFFRPLVEAASKLRFLGITGLVFPFTLVTGGGYHLKVALLTFGMTTFFVTSMAQVVLEVPRGELDHMRVLGASEGRIVYEVIIRGTLDKAMEVMRQNIAMGWSMITMIEGISRAEGGLGAMILNQNKHFHLDEVYAVLFVILGVGLALDYAIGLLTRVLCPYAVMGRVTR